MTALEGFRRALALMGEKADPEAAENAAFLAACPYLLNVVLAELAELNVCLSGGNPEGEMEVLQIGELSDEIPLVPVLSHGVLPLGLAFYLLLEEDPDRADVFGRLYREACRTARAAFARGVRGKTREVY